MSQCPQCGDTTPDGDRCGRCGALLDADIEVLRTSEVTAIPVLKSILDGAEIPYYTRGESMMNLFPSEMLAPSLFRPKGEVCFMVPAEHAEEARQLLTPLSDEDMERAESEGV